MKTTIKVFDNLSDKHKSYLEFKRDLKRAKIDNLINFKVNIDLIELPF